MSKRYKNPAAVMVLLIRNVGGKRCVLLQRRVNTGYMDGHWDCSASGHVEPYEPMSRAMARELREELGIDIAPEMLKMVHFQHSFTPNTDKDASDVTYCNAFFVAEGFNGEPHICEKQKCSELEWFELNNLPDDLIPARKSAIDKIIAGEAFSEWGWPKKE